MEVNPALVPAHAHTTHRQVDFPENPGAFSAPAQPEHLEHDTLKYLEASQKTVFAPDAYQRYREQALNARDAFEALPNAADFPEAARTIAEQFTKLDQIKTLHNHITLRIEQTQKRIPLRENLMLQSRSLEKQIEPYIQGYTILVPDPQLRPTEVKSNLQQLEKQATSAFHTSIMKNSIKLAELDRFFKHEDPQTIKEYFEAKIQGADQLNFTGRTLFRSTYIRPALEQLTNHKKYLIRHQGDRATIEQLEHIEYTLQKFINTHRKQSDETISNTPTTERHLAMDAHGNQHAYGLESLDGQETSVRKPVGQIIDETTNAAHLLAEDLELLRSNAPIPTSPLGDLPALHRATLEGDTEQVQRMLSEGAHLETPDQVGRTPLLVATAYRRLAIMRAFLERGANVNAQDETRHTPLHDIARHADHDGLRLLLAQGAQPNTVDHLGYTPLMNGIESGDADIVRLLLENGAAPTPAALASAVKTNRIDLAVLLLEHGPRTPFHQTDLDEALITASEQNNLNAVHTLLQRGAKIEQNNQLYS